MIFELYVELILGPIFNLKNLIFQLLIVIELILSLLILLQTWKGKLISMAGRLCLIKAVFTAIPLFYLSLYKVSVGVCKTIRRIQAKFLWGWGFEGKKIAWVAWDKVCASIDN